MPRLNAGLLRGGRLPCLSCAAPGGACWCGGSPQNPRHDDGALSGILAGTTWTSPRRGLA